MFYFMQSRPKQHVVQVRTREFTDEDHIQTIRAALVCFLQRQPTNLNVSQLVSLLNMRNMFRACTPIARIKWRRTEQFYSWLHTEKKPRVLDLENLTRRRLRSRSSAC